MALWMYIDVWWLAPFEVWAFRRIWHDDETGSQVPASMSWGQGIPLPIQAHMDSWINVCMSTHFVPFGCNVSLCVLFLWHVEVTYPLWTGDTNVFVLSFAGAIRHCLYTYTLCHGSVYFLHKSEMADECFVGFLYTFDCSLFVHISPPRTLYSRPGAQEVW